VEKKKRGPVEVDVNETERFYEGLKPEVDARFVEEEKKYFNSLPEKDRLYH
jgi:hypothetical protein